MMSTSFHEYPCPETIFRYLPQLPQCARPDSHTAVHRNQLTTSNPQKVANNASNCYKTCTRPDQSTKHVVIGAEKRPAFITGRFPIRQRVTTTVQKYLMGEIRVLRLGRPPRQCNPAKVQESWGKQVEMPPRWRRVSFTV